MTVTYPAPYTGVTIVKNNEESAALSEKGNSTGLPINVAEAIIAVDPGQYPALEEAVKKYKESLEDSEELPGKTYAFLEFKGYRISVTKDDSMYRVQDTSPAEDGTLCTCTVWLESLDEALKRFANFAAHALTKT